jgi:hypothetical protein
LNIHDLHSITCRTEDILKCGAADVHTSIPSAESLVEKALRPAVVA